MEAVTAEASPVTSEVVEAPQVEVPSETAEAPSQETEDSAAPETEATYTNADIEAAKEEATKRERGNWEKWRTDTIAKANTEAAQQQFITNQQRANSHRQGRAQQVLGALLKQANDTGVDTINPQHIQGLAGELNAAHFHEAHQEFSTHLWNTLKAEFPNYQPSQEAAQMAAAAGASYNRQQMVAAQTRMLKEAVIQSTYAQAQDSAAAEAAATTAAVTKPKSTAKPTAVAGVPGTTGNSRSSWKTQLDVDTAFQQGRATLADVKWGRANLK